MSNRISSIKGILNGAIGDSLHCSNNELSIKMGLYHQDKVIDLDSPLADQIPYILSNKVVVFVHGLTNTEAIWEFHDSTETDNYGERLYKNLGITPLFVRYNSGLSIEKNGHLLNLLLEQLVTNYPIEINILTLVGFSMGGLLIRYAQTEAEENWAPKLNSCIYIGTPHEGAPLEKFGDLVGKAFGLFPQPYFKVWEDRINLRSQGIKDLHSGLSAQDFQFVESASHFFISGGLFKQEQSIKDRFFGDSLVMRKSAVPKSAPKSSKSAHFDNIDHISLAHSNAVYTQLRNWFSETTAHVPTHRYEGATWRSKLPPLSIAGKNTENQAAAMLGATKLSLDTFDLTVDTVETMHHSISDEVYDRIEKLPLVKSVKQGQRFVSNQVFSSLRTGASLIRRQLDKSEQATKNDDNPPNPSS